MTKSARIRALYAEGKSTREIADIVGCGTSYVRVCARQRINGLSESDIRYRAKLGTNDYTSYQKALFKKNPDYKRRHRAYCKSYSAAKRRGLPVDKRKDVGRQAYRSAD